MVIGWPSSRSWARAIDRPRHSFHIEYRKDPGDVINLDCRNYPVVSQSVESAEPCRQVSRPVTRRENRAREAMDWGSAGVTWDRGGAGADGPGSRGRHGLDRGGFGACG